MSDQKPLPIEPKHRCKTCKYYKPLDGVLLCRNVHAPADEIHRFYFERPVDCPYWEWIMQKTVNIPIVKKDYL